MRDKGAKRAASGKLHIDDGCMGGGDPVPYKNNGRIKNREIAGDDNDFYDYKWGNGWDKDSDGRVDITTDNLNGYFDSSRWKIFHYCLIVEQPWCDSEGNVNGVAEGPGNKTYNIGKRGGDDILIKYKSDTTYFADLFMHEIGHNFGLPDQYDKSTKTMYDLRRLETIEYSTQDWGRMNLDLINSPRSD